MVVKPLRCSRTTTNAKDEGEAEHVSRGLTECAGKRTRSLKLGVLLPPLIEAIRRILGKRAQKWARRAIFGRHQRQLDQLLKSRSRRLKAGIPGRTTRRHLVGP